MPNGTKIKAVVFDLDGTLLNTLEDLKDAVNFALEKNGLPPRTLSEIRQFVGNGIRNLILCATPDGGANPAFAAVFADFQSYYAVHYKDRTDAYEGIFPLLAALRERGIAMAIVSNKVDSAVKSLNRDYFSGYIGIAVGETVQIARKPAPDSALAALRALGVSREEALYVGDSDVDIQTAANAGMRCISVTWGFRDRTFLLAHGAQTLIDSPMELLDYL